MGGGGVLARVEGGKIGAGRPGKTAEGDGREIALA